MVLFFFHINVVYYFVISIKCFFLCCFVTLSETTKLLTLTKQRDCLPYTDVVRRRESYLDLLSWWHGSILRMDIVVTLGIVLAEFSHVLYVFFVILINLLKNEILHY